MTNQQSLFVDGEPARDICHVRETSDSVSRMVDRRSERRLTALVEKLERAHDPVERARIASEIRDLSEALVAANIRRANQAGVTWRQISAELDIPFQTLYRRYAGSR